MAFGCVEGLEAKGLCPALEAGPFMRDLKRWVAAQSAPVRGRAGEPRFLARRLYIVKGRAVRGKAGNPPCPNWVNR